LGDSIGSPLISPALLDESISDPEEEDKFANNSSEYDR
jgi:hypothetical protein